MATYWQWKSRHPEYKRIYYICGEEYAMAQEVKDAVIQQWLSGNERFICLSFDAHTVGFAEIESAVLTVSHSVTRMVVIENAQVLAERHWQKIGEWARAVVDGGLPLRLLTIVTNEVKPDTAQEKFRVFVESGRFVECKAATVESLVRYCQTDYGLDEDTANELIALCGYNFRKLNNELEKLSIVCNQINIEDVRRLVVYSPTNVLIDKLLAGDAKSAHDVVDVITIDQVPKVFGLLAYKLRFLLQCSMIELPGMNAHRLAAIVGCQPWQLLEYFKAKKYWSAASLERELQLLVEAEYLFHVDRSIFVLYWLVLQW